jgi:integrase
MEAMPRPRPPHLHRETTRHGKTVWYVRVDKGARIRLRAEFGTEEFNAQYRMAVSVQPPPTKGGPASGTLEWLIDRYRETAAWQIELSAATRRQRENIFKQVIASAGNEPYRRITEGTIIAGRDRRAATPDQARHFLDTMRGLFRWARDARHVKVDPTSSVKNPPRKKGPGFVAWTEEDVARYEKRWPLGTRQRVWLDVILYSGLRRGDAVRFGRPHVRNGIGRIKVEKADGMITVTIPILPVLQTTLDAGPVGDLTFIVGARGEPLTKESFGNEFREACRAAEVKGSAHGVRKIAAATAAMNGATTEQLKALFGWTSDAMPALYTRSADRDRMGREAGRLLLNDERTSIPAPKRQVRAPERKGE